MVHEWIHAMCTHAGRRERPGEREERARALTTPTGDRWGGAHTRCAAQVLIRDRPSDGPGSTWHDKSGSHGRRQPRSLMLESVDGPAPTHSRVRAL